MAIPTEIDPALVADAVTDGADGDATGLAAVPEAVTQQTEALVRERPFVALAGAVLAGFLVSRILSRR
jgi:ElaB/YqjD/DUF883 family membrane-anchored ribosome-binding protein